MKVTSSALPGGGHPGYLCNPRGILNVGVSSFLSVAAAVLTPFSKVIGQEQPGSQRKKHCCKVAQLQDPTPAEAQGPDAPSPVTQVTLSMTSEELLADAIDDWDSLSPTEAKL